LSVPGILEFFDERRRAREPVVLVTVYETQGSTYSKAGAQMLLDGAGRFHGMLSGGCLEGDLAVRAAEVVASGSPQVVTYDLAQDDELWGLGVGCDGLMRVLLQPLTADSNYEPFTTIAEIYDGTDPRRFALVVDTGGDEIEAGASVLEFGDGLRAFGVDEEIAETLIGCGDDDGIANCSAGAGSIKVLRTTLKPAPRILVLGAGMDAEPVVRMATELGWRCTVVDHRDTYIERGSFDRAEAVICAPAENLAAAVRLSQFDAAIVMSHHLVSDRAYLRQLAETEIGYVGLLGPVNRRDRLLAELGAGGESLDGRIHGPAGLDIGGRGAAAIALSIVAQVQNFLGRG
jgi:xanthine/CO dehydrogenase XdhC/CoxF family maturation factor